MKIVKLDIDENSVLAGIDAVALVEQPAIEEDFMYFSKQDFAETYTNYPQAAVEAAKQGIKRNKENNNKCATQVGKVRAQQLANREPISLDTVRRMRSFLIRQKDNYELQRDRRNYDACGYISYLLWGGPSALPWAEKILRQAGEEFAEVGPRGGVKASPKAPKSKTKNPNPKGKGTAKGNAGTTRGAKVSKEIEKSLQKKSDDFNEKYKEKLGYGANIGALKAVYQRGLGAYNTSRSPAVAARGGAKQWAMARVNAFLYLLKNGRPQNKKYTTDYDLLPAKHPKKEAMSKIVEGLITEFAIIDKIDGINVYSTKEEAIAKAKEIGCDGYHEHTLESGEIAYMPCAKHSEATDKALQTTFDSLPDDRQDAILDALESVGISDDEMVGAGYIEVDKTAFYKEVFATITSTPNKPSTADFGNLAVRYRYTGPRDSRNRDFCARLMKLNKVFRKEDINNLSITGANEEFGIYDIFRYKGSYNCRHYWEEVFYKRDSDVTNNKRPLAKSNRILDGTTLNRPVIQTKTGKADKESFAAVDEQQILVGPLMTPNKLIPRRDENGDEYFVYFTEDTIKKLAYKAMKDKIIDRVNIEHSSDDRVDAYLVESWLVEDEDKDKSLNYGFSPKKGQWYGKYKVEDLGVWDGYIKSGLVKGFSVEGLFESIMMSKTRCRKNGSCACGMTQHPGGLCDGSHLKIKK